MVKPHPDGLVGVASREGTMKKILATGALLATLGGLVPTSAQAGAATDAALGLGAFAVFNQLWGGHGFFGHRERVIVVHPYYGGYYSGYYPPAVYPAPVITYYSPPPAATYAPLAPSVQTEVVYPHGKYVLRGDGVTVAYYWVWIPNPPPPPAAPPSQ